VIVIAPSVAIVPAKLPANPPEEVVVEPSMGSEGTTPDVTVVPLVTSSPSMYDSLNVNASPAVVISAPMGVYPTAVPDESAPRPPKELPDFTDILEPLTE
jgi:hypothetical protein